MIEERLSVGVEVEERPGVTRWQRSVWQPVALVPGRSRIAPWTLLRRQGEVRRYFAGNADVIFRAPDTKVLKDNLEARTPAIYVVLRRAPAPPGWGLYLVTADPSEAHAHADVGADLVEALPMPEAIQCRLAAFVARHHVERREWRRRRDRADPEALARRSPLREAGRA